MSRRRPDAGDDAADDGPEEPRVDLHGLPPDAALRRLAKALHAARVRRAPTLLAITGAGHGNRLGEPILRARVETWLDGPDGRRHGARGWERVARGGALRVRLAR